MEADSSTADSYRRIFRRSLVAESILLCLWIVIACVSDRGMARRVSLAIIVLFSLLIALHLRFVLKVERDAAEQRRFSLFAFCSTLVLAALIMAHAYLGITQAGQRKTRAVRVGFSCLAFVANLVKTRIHWKFAKDSRRTEEEYVVLPGESMSDEQHIF